MEIKLTVAEAYLAIGKFVAEHPDPDEMYKYLEEATPEQVAHLYAAITTVKETVEPYGTLLSGALEYHGFGLSEMGS